MGAQGTAFLAKVLRWSARFARILRVCAKRKARKMRRKAQQVLQLYERNELRLTSSTWGGWWFAALLLAVVFGVGVIYLHFIPDKADTLQHLHKADTLQHLQFYAVIVIGLGSLYIAGTSFWAKRGSAFFVEYQTATDSNVAELTISPITQEETIGNPVNSIIPYVKKIYIRNEKNRYEAIKRILLKLPNNQTLILEEYDTADALLIKPYEDKAIELNAVTVYFKQFDLLKNKEDHTQFAVGYAIESKDMLDKGEIIVETAQGQSYIKNNKKSVLTYSKETLLHPARHYFWDGVGNKKLIPGFDAFGYKKLILGFDVFGYKKIIMKEHFIDNKVFFRPLIKHLDSYPQVAFKFNKRKGEFGIQITLNKKKETTLSYFFLSGEIEYSFPVQQELQKEFIKAYNKHNFSKIKTRVREKNNIKFFEILNKEFFFKQLADFCHEWAIEKWGEGGSSIYKHVRGDINIIAAFIEKIKIIDDEEP